MHRVLAAILVFLMRLITGVRARWAGCGPSAGQRIYFANHSSHLDALVIWAALPAPLRRLTRPVAARDYWGGTAFRRYLAHRVFNAVLIDRDRARAPMQTIDQIVAALGQQYSLIIFPEGTRGDGQSVQDFKSGLYHLAKARPDVELVPVYLQNLNRALPKGETLPVPVLGSATFGAPLRLDAEENKHAFVSRARGALVELGEAA